MGPPLSKPELVAGVPSRTALLGTAALLEATSLEVASARARRNPAFWLAFLCLALLLHVGLLPWIPWPERNRQTRKAVKINTIDPAKLEAIRRQWQGGTPLLNRSQPRSDTAPPDAKYISDRNIRVEKEQRAAVTDVIPAPTPGAGQDPRQATKPRTVPLKNLALPLPLDPNPDGWRRRSTPQRESESPTEEQMPIAGGGPDQTTFDDKLAVGSQNLLNAQESVHYSYYARMYQQVGPIWRSAVMSLSQRFQPSAGDYQTQADVIFDATGQVKEVRILRSSGISQFDQVVVESWKKIAKVPNPPQELIDENGEVHTAWSFTVRVDGSFGMRRF